MRLRTALLSVVLAATGSIAIAQSAPVAQTPPMGWNSWNFFAERVTDKDIRAAADQLVATGMKDAGYIYVNIDDTWEAERDATGKLHTNSKFPDMKALADYVHSKGLKIGIYSGPGNKTCGGYAASLGHEQQDADMYAEWGFDYLKYDLCSFIPDVMEKQAPNDKAAQMKLMIAAYEKMGKALQSATAKTGRPILFSLCQYGWDSPWEWAPELGGNAWRTTGDVEARWQSIYDIASQQAGLASYAGPGHWNDPDMLEVGNGGMTATEYRTHFTLWCLLSAPLMAGNDLRTMSDETRSILTNREVIALDQDAFGHEATRAFAKDGIEVFTKFLSDGTFAVGIFNRNAADTPAEFTWADAGIPRVLIGVRDLWRHQDLAVSRGFSGTVPAHGVVALKLRPVAVEK